MDFDFDAAENELGQALMQADAAGDVASAQKIAGMLRGVINKKRETAERSRLNAQQLAEMNPAEKLAVGFQRGLRDVYHGAQQLGAQIGEGVGVYPKGTASDFTRSKEEELNLFDPLAKDSPVLAGGARIAGNIAALPIPGGVGASTGARVATGALAGAAQGGIGFTREGESRGKNTLLGGTIGAVLPAAVEGVLKTGKVTAGGVRKVADALKGAMPNMTPAMRERAAAQMIRDAASNPDVLASLSRAQQHVPGTRQTLAEAADDIGLAGLQRHLAAKSPELNTRIQGLAQDNNAARVAMIQGAFGGADEGAAVAIEAARDAATRPMLRTAYAQAPRIETRAKEGLGLLDSVKGKRMSASDFGAITETAKIMRAVQRGAMTLDDANAALAQFGPTSKTARDALMASAARLNQGVNLRPVIKHADRILKRREGNDTISAVIGDVRNKLAAAADDVERLHNVRQEIGYILGGQSTQHGMAGKDASAELMSLRQALDDRIAKAAPEFKRWLTEYAGRSKDAGRVRMGAELLSKSAPNFDALGNPVLSPAKFANAANDLDRTARAATGFRKETAARLLTPEQQQTIGAVRSDLDRVANLNKGMGPNSVTAANMHAIEGLMQAAGNAAGNAAPRGLMAMMPVLKGIQAKFSGETIDVLQNALMDPAYAQQVLARFPPQQRAQVASLFQNPQFIRWIRGAGAAGGMAGAAGATGAGPQQ